MVKNPGETPGVGTIRPLNPPVPTDVVEDEHGTPVTVAIGAGRPTAVPHRSAPAITGVQGTASPPGPGVSPDSPLSRGGSGRPTDTPHKSTPPKHGRRASPARALRVTAIEDRWEIDEEWWRTRPVSRMYYRVLLEDGQALTIYRDMLNGIWYRQRY